MFESWLSVWVAVAAAAVVSIFLFLNLLPYLPLSLRSRTRYYIRRTRNFLIRWRRKLRSRAHSFSVEDASLVADSFNPALYTLISRPYDRPLISSLKGSAYAHNHSQKSSSNPSSPLQESSFSTPSIAKRVRVVEPDPSQKKSTLLSSSFFALHDNASSSSSLSCASSSSSSSTSSSSSSASHSQLSQPSSSSASSSSSSKAKRSHQHQSLSVSSSPTRPLRSSSLHRPVINTPARNSSLSTSNKPLTLRKRISAPADMSKSLSTTTTTTTTTFSTSLSSSSTSQIVTTDLADNDDADWDDMTSPQNENPPSLSTTTTPVTPNANGSSSPNLLSLDVHEANCYFNDTREAAKSLHRESPLEALRASSIAHSFASLPPSPLDAVAFSGAGNTSGNRLSLSNSSSPAIPSPLFALLTPTKPEEIALPPSPPEDTSLLPSSSPSTSSPVVDNISKDEHGAEVRKIAAISDTDLHSPVTIITTCSDGDSFKSAESPTFPTSSLPSISPSPLSKDIYSNDDNDNSYNTDMSFSPTSSLSHAAKDPGNMDASFSSTSSTSPLHSYPSSLSPSSPYLPKPRRSNTLPLPLPQTPPTVLRRTSSRSHVQQSPTPTPI